MKCPKCSSELHAKATYCGCGWRESGGVAARNGNVVALPDSRHFDCEWDAGDKRCRYLGTWSGPDTGGRWLCTEHSKCKGDPLWGSQIVDASWDDHPRPVAWTRKAQLRWTAERATQDALEAGYGQMTAKEGLAALKAFRLKTW